MNKFYPFQPVLVRCLPTEIWNTAFFDSEWNVSSTEIVYRMIGGDCYSQCIPYEGNEKYIHTTVTPNPNSTEWKPVPGEMIEVSNTGADDTWVKAKFIEMEDSWYVCSVDLSVHIRLLWQYARKLQEPQKKAEDTPESSEWKPTPGELVAVRDYDDDCWTIRWFTEIHTDGTYKCIMWAYPDKTVTWNQCISIDALKKLEHPHKECKHSISSEIKSEDTQIDSGWVPTPGELIEVSDNLGKDFWPKLIFKGMSGDKYICGSGDFITEWMYARKPKAVIKESGDTPPIPNSGDLVAVRDCAYAAWNIRIFSHMENHRYACFGWSDALNNYKDKTFTWRECVPLYLCQPVISALIGNKQ